MMTKKPTQKTLQPLDFKQWSNMARQDADAFESMRLAAIEELIESAPEKQKQRLRCLQWRIDQERRLSHSPLGACIQISQMMWETLMGEDGLIDHIQHLNTSCKQERFSTKSRPQQASIISIRPDC